MIRDLIEKSEFAIRHYEDKNAKHLIKELERVIVSQNIETSNYKLFLNLKKIINHLKIIAIPQLSENELEDVMKNHFLDAFYTRIDMENRLTGKLFYLPEIPRDQLREKLKRALLQNTQRLGNLTVGQWIQEFERSFPINQRSLNASLEFAQANPSAQKLDPMNKEKLKELLHVYDYLLVTTIPFTEPLLSEFLATAEANKTGAETYRPVKPREYFTPANPTAESSIQTSLEGALKQFPNLGEQILTSQRIKIQAFPEPARPSLKNWIADYTFKLGYEKHDAMQRTDYLFRSENAMPLSAQERDRLSYILKAFDENMPVTVNKNLQQIVFPVTKLSPEMPPISQTRPQNPTRNFERLAIPQQEKRDSFNLLHHLEKEPQKEATPKMQFTHHQKMPYENNAPSSRPANTPALKRKESFVSKNTSANSRQLGKNVVNLREE